MSSKSIGQCLQSVGLALLKILGVIAFWLFVWYIAAKRINMPLLLPAPKEVFLSLGNLIVKAEFWNITFHSIRRILVGILAAFGIGILLAVATTRSKILNLFLTPVLTVIKSTPVASFIILVFVWMQTDTISSFITSLIVIPMVWSNISEGIRAVDPALKDVAAVYGFSVWKRLKVLYMPTIAPYFMATCKAALGMAWKAGIAAEILAPPDVSIGHELNFAKNFLEIPTAFAWTLVVIVFSLIFEKLFVWSLEKLGQRFRLLSKGGIYAAT